MPCDIHRDKHGQMTKIVCSRGPLKCRWCGVPSSKLCDFLINGNTCDAPMCSKHAKSISYQVDYCPDHQHAEVSGLGTHPKAQCTETRSLEKTEFR